jgi:hypothetical protein
VEEEAPRLVEASDIAGIEKSVRQLSARGLDRFWK